MQVCKDGSGLQFIKFDFVTGGQEIKLSIFEKSNISLLAFGDYFFQ